MINIIDYVINSIISISGTIWIFAIILGIVFTSLLIIFRISINETWPLSLPAIAGLTPRFGGSWLPEWTVVLLIIPFGILIAEVIKRQYGGQRE